MERTPDPGAGTEERYCSFKTFFYSPLSPKNQESSLQGSREEARRKNISFLNLGRCPEHVPPGDWPIPKED